MPKSPPPPLTRFAFAAKRDAAPEAVLTHFMSWVRAQGLSPFAHQEAALRELTAGRHVVLATPTGSGKSLVALGLHALALCAGQRSFYTAPIKALVSEKFFALCRVFGAEHIGMLTGDASINPHANIVCCTQEVLASMALRADASADASAGAPRVVMDEFHYYDDPERGHAWQTPLLALAGTQFLLMSATLGNTAPIREALHAQSGREVTEVYSDERPVPLDFAYFETPLAASVQRLLREKRAPVYLVSFTQRDAARRASALTSTALTTPAAREEIRRAIAGFRFDSPYGRELRRMLASGVGLHHAGLLPRYRLLVEQLSQRGLLRVISGTDTLGVGVNIPIRTVLFTGLAKYDGQRERLLSVREFQQIAGRAGRRGFDVRGSVVCQMPPREILKQKREREAPRRGRRGGRAHGRSKRGERHARRNLRASRRRAAAGGDERQRPGATEWNAAIFRKLARARPEALHSRFRMSHGLLLQVLQRAAPSSGKRGGYGDLAQLIARSHTRPPQKRQMLREAARLFRSLREAGVIQISKAPRVRVATAGELQDDFSLHHTLSLFLVDLLTPLDPQQPGSALRILSCVEGVLQSPRLLLHAQVRAQKRRARAKLQRAPYRERMAKLRALQPPQPEAAFLAAGLKRFAARYPWMRPEFLRPKSIARELLERGHDFNAYVAEIGVAQHEGVLLRYLKEVHTTLEQTVPDVVKNTELRAYEARLREVLQSADTSLQRAWQAQLDAARAQTAAAAAHEKKHPRRPQARGETK